MGKWGAMRGEKESTCLPGLLAFFFFFFLQLKLPTMERDKDYRRKRDIRAEALGQAK